TGNLVQTAQVGSTKHDLTLALGFGASQDEAVRTAGAALRTGFDSALGRYHDGWADYDDGLIDPPNNLPGLGGTAMRELPRVYQLSANVLKASEDKTFPGAIVASLASPWGQAVSAGDPNNTYFGSYREGFARDLYEAWPGLLRAGGLRDARPATPTPRPPARPPSSSSNASSCPTAPFPATALSTARRRPTRSTHSSTS